MWGIEGLCFHGSLPLWQSWSRADRMSRRTGTCASAFVAVSLGIGLGFLARSALGQWMRRRRIRSRTSSGFEVWDALRAGKYEVGDLPLCRVFLMDDANYPCWLVLVPRIQGAVEVIDLSEAQQEQLWKEVSLASAVVKDLYGPDKLNVAAIGNVVAQLHVHITGRLATDPSWPGPCYGAKPPVPLSTTASQDMISSIRGALSLGAMETGHAR